MLIGPAQMAIALAIDAAIGWPDALYTRIGHPVVWLGRLISAGDKALNHDTAAFPQRRLNGTALALAMIVLCTALGRLLDGGPEGWPRIVIGGILAWPLVAARSLQTHVAAVARPLATGDTEGARAAVAMIVGRDTRPLDTAGIARAAIESLAENTSDGVIAPLLWGAAFGLPGIMAYKAINTMDSMIGHRTPRHHTFGWAAARIDDLANLIPARLTGLLYALASRRPRAALRVMARDARHHRSPNAGWPEAACAGALNIRLSGPRLYAEGPSSDPWLNPGAPDPDAASLGAALALYRRVVLIAAALLLAGALT